MAGEDSLGVYRDAISSFTEGLLRPYIDGLSGATEPRYLTKEFNDPIWGTIVLQTQEVIVLDSPLLQRLRRIRQLGVAHLVYPAAVHTRLEHSLGVCHQVSRLADSINTHPPKNNPLLDSETVGLLRLTGLCHDIGHGLMSHVVENALRNDDRCQQLLLDFRRSIRKDGKVQLSQLAAHYMMQSVAFSDLLEAAFKRAHMHFDPALPLLMSKIVIGESVSDELPLLHELISGPFDADKLDYMPRDAVMCGVPIVTDINRLIQKVRAVALPLSDLPVELQAAVSKGASRYVVVGLAPSGASTLDEVALGRSLMFDKIYRHQKVRAIEAMVAAVVDQIGHIIQSDQALLPLRLCDEDFLSLTRRRIEEMSGNTIQPDEEDRVAVGLDIVDRIARRQLFVRAFAFSQHMPQDPYRGDREHRRSIEEMIRRTSEADTRLEFVERVSAILAEITTILQRQAVLGMFRNSDPTPYIWVDPPASSIPDTKPDPNRAYLIGIDGVPRRVDQVNAETRGWSDAYVNTHDMGFVFTVAELAPYVNIASAVAARVLFGTRMPPQMHEYSKQDPGILDELRHLLEKAGFYDRYPADLRPLPEILARGDADTRLQAIARNMHSYSGPEAATQEPGVISDPTFTAIKVSDWVRQFGPKHARAALAVVEKVMLLGRVETDATLHAFFANPEHERFRGASIVPMGDPKDGSAIVAYHAGDVAPQFDCTILALSEALTRSEPVIFIDDFIGRGSSTISILEAMLGRPDTQHLNEERPGALDPEVIKRLLGRPVAFLFTAGLDEGRAELPAQAQQMGFVDAVVFVHKPQDELPALKSVLLEGIDTAARDAFLAECVRIGDQLLVKPGHDEQWRSERAAGYGNHALLAVFPYNTPTATLTALWAAGTVDGSSWRPLFPRRQKL